MATPELEPPEPDYSGSTFDRYRLIRRLGVGGMGAVYEAEHTELRKHCAVKMLRHELAQNELFRRRFLREARAASAVAHPHVVDISDFGQTPDGQVYFVMELLHGRELQSLLEEQGRLSWPRTREILLQVTSALEAAHRLGVIHRDIKPANCFLVDLPGLGGEDFVKVLDFGIAKVSSKLDESTKQLTSTQEIFGTVTYMAPEMAMGKSDDPRSDIYSLGVMMYRMLVGELPFAEGNAFQILSQHVSVRPPLPRDKVPSIPEEVEAIILKAMAKKPAERFSTMEEFGQALRRGSVATTSEPLELQATVLGMQPLGAEGSRPIPIEKTTPLPSSGVVVEPAGAREGSGPMRASDSGTMSLGEEPTMIATPSSGKRLEPTMALDASLGAHEATPSSSKRLEPTVALGASPAAHEATPTLEPPPARRKRSTLWIALPTVGLLAVGGAAFVLFTGSRDDAPVVAAQEARPAPSTPASPEPAPPTVAIVPTAEGPSLGTSKDAIAEPGAAQAPPVPTVAEPPAPEPRVAEPPAPEPRVAEPPAPEPRVAEPPAPEPRVAEPTVEPEPPPPPEPTPAPAPKKTTSKPKPASKPSSSSSDAIIKKRLKSKILDECRFEMAGKRVTVSFIVTPSGGISMLTASPKNEGAQCAKEQVVGTKFQSRSSDTPIKIVVQ